MKFGIWKEYHYYAGEIKQPKDHWVVAFSGDFPADEPEPLEFDDEPSAQKWIDENTGGGRYYLANGEYARPTFSVKRR